MDRRQPTIAATPAPAPQPTPTPLPTATPPLQKPTPPRQKTDRGQHPQPTPRKPRVIPEETYRAAVWAKVANTRTWTETVLRSTRYYREDLEQARDLDDFCPGYEKASKHQKHVCWLRLISAVVKYESEFNPHQRYREPTGEISIGLMQLSDGECILEDDRHPNLEDPLKNLKCGIAMMARYIRRDHYIDGPLWARGAATYWSTLRRPYRFLGMQLGKKNEVIVHTKNYQSF